MKYSKPPLSYQQQVDLLQTRGLIIEDPDELIRKLKTVSYYRLSGYWYSFLNDDDTFKPETHFSYIWRLYTFDRQLRVLVMDAIERVEVAIKTALAYELVHSAQYSPEEAPFCYIYKQTFPYMSVGDHDFIMEKIKDEIKRSKEKFIEHFYQTYGSEHEMPPLWMAVELMSFNTVLKMLQGIDKKHQKDIARTYGVTEEVLISWLYSLLYIRNLCAHHGRLWNRKLGLKPLIPRHDPRWHKPIQVENSRMFAVLTILVYMLKIIVPRSHWKERLYTLFSRFPEVEIEKMGFLENWKDNEIWMT